jgi:putative heme degradation protein
MTKTAWTEHVHACKGMGLTREEIRQWYWVEKEAKEAELDAAKVSSDTEESSDEDESSEEEEECVMVSKGLVRKASKTLEDQHKSMTTPKKGQLTRRQSLALVEKSAKDFIKSRNVSKIRRH